jgi:hypothetical protein
MFQKVRDDITSIEDKLYERGLIYKATRDSHASVSVYFRNWVFDGELGPYCIISIRSDDPSIIEEDKYEIISEFVNEKISDLSEDWPSHLKTYVSNIWGYVVLLNEKKIY